jgi:hypothetical protein
MQLRWLIAAKGVPLKLRALYSLVRSSTSAPCKHLICLQSRSSHSPAPQQPSPQCLSTVRLFKRLVGRCVHRQPAFMPAKGLGRCVSACKATAPGIFQDWTRGSARCSFFRVTIQHCQASLSGDPGRSEKHQPVEPSGWQLTGLLCSADHETFQSADSGASLTFPQQVSGNH